MADYCVYPISIAVVRPKSMMSEMCDRDLFPHIFAAYFAILCFAYFEKKFPRISDMPRHCNLAAKQTAWVNLMVSLFTDRVAPV